MPEMEMGPNIGDFCFKRRFRWLLFIDEISARGVNALPPSKGARPSLSFKTIQAEHLNETIFFAGKPEWKPISLVLYDLKTKQNAVFEWLKLQYDPEQGDWHAPQQGEWKKPNARLELYDGCGKIIETWRYDNVWPESIEWGELDMGNSEYLTVDLSIRYDRAYLLE